MCLFTRSLDDHLFQRTQTSDFVYEIVVLDAFAIWSAEEPTIHFTWAFGYPKPIGSVPRVFG
jgi:hypothetical protein